MAPSRRLRRRWIGIVLVVAMATFGIAGVASAVALAVLLVGGSAEDVAHPGPVVVELAEMAYLPDEIVVPADTATPLLLRNTGSLQHDFSIDALRLSPDVRPGEERPIELTAPAGQYEIYCTFPGHREAGMAAILVAEP